MSAKAGAVNRMDKLLHNPVSNFIDAALRGIAQVFFQDNPLTGLIFLIGIFISSYVAGFYMLLAVIVATGTAMLLGVSREQISKGLFGFNATLTGLALELYMKHNLILPPYVILAAIFVAIVTAFIQDALKPYQVPVLTSAFVLTTWLFIGALYSYGRIGGVSPLPVPHLPVNAPITTTTLTPNDAVLGFFNGVAQVFFQQDIWTGVAILVGVFINSRISCLAAVVGSLIGIGVAWALGGDAASVRAGLFGFNPVLTAVGLGGIYYSLSAKAAVPTVVMTIVAAVVTTVVYGTISTVLGPIGLPVLTSAFVFTTWVCLFATKSLTRLQAIPPNEATKPEHHLKATPQAKQR
jgi:urea transporter